MTNVVAWEGAGRAAMLDCDGNLADVEWDPDFDPIGGAWGRAQGLWRLQYLPRANDHPAYETFIEAVETTEPIEDMAADVGTIRVFRAGSLWWRREERTDMVWLYELCFDSNGIVRGEHRVDDRRVQFEQVATAL